MANTDKDIVITPNRGSAADPTIRFTGGNATVANSSNITVYPDGTLNFDGVVGVGTTTVKADVKLAVSSGNIQLITSGKSIEFSDGTRQTTAFISPLAVSQGGTGLQSGTSGGVLYYSATGTLASSGALAASALVVGGGAGVAPSTITTGTGVVTALGVAVGSAGAFVTFNGALGTPSSGTLTNCTFPTLNQNTTGYAAGIAGGALGQLHYQTAINTTGFVGVGTAGWVLTGAGAALPQWTQATNTNTASTIVQRDASGNFSAGTITATLSGNASSATTATSATSATTATNIASGTAGQILYQSSAGATSFVGVGTSGWVLTGTGAALPQWTLATNANTASTIVQRDASGNFSAGTITATLSGSATSAGTATTATTATNVAGGALGQLHYQTGANTTGFVGVGTSGWVLTGQGSALPQWIQATNTNTASTIVQRDASGNFSAGTITATLSGSATSAGTATTATNVAGGTAGALAYQTGAGATSFISAGASGTVLTGTGGTPAYSASPSLTTSLTVPAIYGGTAVSSTLILQSTSGAGTSDSITFKTGNAGANTAMTINTSGNVGIGTTNPLALFVVGSLGSTGGESTYGGYMKINANRDFVTTAGGTAGDSGLEFKSSTTTSGYGWIISNPDRTGGNTPLSFAYRNNSASWTELVTMRSDTGRVGIGTISPAARLSVYGGNVQIDTGSNNFGIVFSDSTYQRTAYPGPNTGTSGGVLYFNSTNTLASSGALAASALVVGGGAGAAPSTITTGTGVVTALGVAVGSAGAFVTFNGALGTPSSGTLTNCTFPTLNQNTTGYAAGIAGGALGQLHYQTGANTTGFVGVGTSGWVLTGAGSALPQWTQATNANTASTIVQRDASGNFSAGTITATLSGSATSATTATNIASGTTGQIPYQSGAGTTAFVGVGTASYALVGNGAAAPSWLQYTNANTASTIVQRDASGNFSAGTITASLTGTASTATNVAGGALGQLHYQTGSGTTGFVGVGTSGWFLTGAGSALPQWTQVVPVANGGTGLSTGTSGGILYYSAAGTLASSGALAASALVVGGGAGAAPSTITTGTSVVTALGVAVGSAGAFVVNGGVLGTPSSGTLTSCTSATLALSNNSTNIANSEFVNRALYNVRGAPMITGGGTVSYDGTNVKWTARFIVIGNSKGTSSPGSADYYDILCPSTGNVNVVGTTAVTATASGIPLPTWCSLYYDTSAGTGQGSTAFNIVNYSTSTANYMVPATWIWIASRNDDSSYCKFANGLRLDVGESYDVASYSSVKAPIAVNISAGTAGAIPYQTGASTTSFISAGASGTVLTGTGGTPAYSASPTISTSVTTPIHYGGTAVSSTLTLQTTTAAGTSDSMLFKVGNAVQAIKIDTVGRVIIGQDASTTFNLRVNSSTLGTTAGSQSYYQQFYSPDGNADYLEITNTRETAGSSWVGAGSRIQQKIDATWMGYIQFNGGNSTVAGGALNSGGISFGTGLQTGPTAVPERMRIDTNGNVGIGTANPTADLHVQGNMSVRWFIEFEQTITSNYTIKTGYNAMTAGPITINSGVTVTVPSGSTWTII